MPKSRLGDWIANYRGYDDIVKSWGPDWETRCVVNSPHRTLVHTEQELTQMGFVGLYFRKAG